MSEHEKKETSTLRPLPVPRLSKESEERALAYLKNNPVSIMIRPWRTNVTKDDEE
jgi:hypothetical protein